MEVKITGQNPIQKHVYSTFYRGKRFDVNTLTNSVTIATFNDKTGSRFLPVKSSVTKNKVLSAVLQHIAGNKDQ